jgi:hypothetical protein
VMAIKVVREDESNLDFGTGLMRVLGYIVSGLVLDLGFLWVLWDSKKQCWQDKLAKTVVVETGDQPKTVIAVGILGCGRLAFLVSLALVVTAGVGFYSLVKSGGLKLPSNTVFNTSYSNLVNQEVQSELNY